FKLKELPFRLSPDPQFLYLSKQHARAKAYMESTIWFTDGFVVITGEIGSGKTTLIEAFLREIPADVVVAQINQTQVNATDFLQAVLVQFGFSPFKMKKAELISTLNTFLIEQHAAGRKVLLIVDEAQNLEPRVLEEIRLLSGVETTKEKVLRIILAGQPELNDTLNSPRLEQLTQRVRLRFHLATLSETETRAYIEHRLEVAGAGDREIFAADTFPEIYRYAGGVPRLINTLCDTAMMAAFTENRGSVRLADVSSAIAELHWPPYAARVQGAPVGPESPTGPHPVIPARPAPVADSPEDSPRPAAASSGAASPEPPSPAAVSRFPDVREEAQHEAAAREAVARAIEAHAAEAREAAATAAAAHDASAPEPPAAARAPAAQHEPVNERAAAQRGAAGEPVGKLLVATEGRTVQEVPLRIGRLIVGRTPDNDVHIDSRFVSRHHCQIITTANSCVIEDLNSTNGVYVKSARVRRHYLNDGDVVLIGKHELIYMDDRAGRGRASAPAGDAGDHSEGSRRAGG
ncbi:MAG TPA: AAA family ATPase, partial [Steroidobacteraceae bacterium]|nr:AAA family ATPase [Steroidobacteraceae bacterium]